jgi:hypothetical protein
MKGRNSESSPIIKFREIGVQDSYERDRNVWPSLWIVWTVTNIVLVDPFSMSQSSKESTKVLEVLGLVDFGVFKADWDC